MAANPHAQDPLLAAESLTYQVDGTALVDRVDLALRPGELTGLIGPNGAGKTTLLRLLLGYLAPTAGKVLLQQQDLHELPARQRARRIAYMGQHTPLPFPFSVAEVVEMGSFPVLGLGRAPGSSERRAAMEALHYVGLGGLADRSFPTLSGGEQQLALFARVLIQDTPVILLDEPTASLDLGHETRLLRMARELCSEGRSVLVALHNLNSAAEYGDRLLLMDRGRIVADGSPAEVLTEQQLEHHYHTPVRISTNQSTGSILVTPAAEQPRGARGRVHLIGGAGSAVTLTRELHLMGLQVSGGVAHELDNDARLWRSLAIPYTEVPAFAEIGSEALTAAEQLAGSADLVILCSFPVGRGNLGNLRLAVTAAEQGRLAIADEETGTCRRDFYTPESRQLYQHLLQLAPLYSYDQLITMVLQTTDPDAAASQQSQVSRSIREKM
ncbi:heme ABC transporter ATP-binding protein [Spirochaeta africana]|uniref:ABC-type cobalamin/Fe3+-siderophore transport system, ATPase component n=1 Tax=Spirochaeta africana (strain ATCC 700263 / DSM 8902 / Z-7692) TaxID=889378 RepID=H9UL91_SPIAZ|nr:heme ABC transporter ATP-binding protein [Spirochaeta africana]AFG38284.1 ABC-type cobalamin/Fe3+-siderophore transport system, ATPase component [Spirochaeta africana DSM 8902]